MREVAMWSIALLVSTSTWSEIEENWKLICQVFLSYSTNSNLNFKCHHAKLLSRISKITNDPNSTRAINQSNKALSNTNDPFLFGNEDELDDYDNSRLNLDKNVKFNNKRKSFNSNLNSSYNNRSTIDEEEELNEANSPFKIELQAIYCECLEASIRNDGNLSSFEKIKGARQWLSCINQRCIPTIPIWSNILLGLYD
ncbi:unnamed protein product [Rotaria sp. Silwood2]|nr:unnamed protein product [Rotaria sp. Silwood2]